MSNALYLFHKEFAPHGKIHDASNFESLIRSGWATGPHEYGKTPDEILESDRLRKLNDVRDKEKGSEPYGDLIMLYHKIKAVSGTLVSRSDEAKLISEGWVTGPQYFNDVPDLGSGIEKIRKFTEEEIEAYKKEAKPEEPLIVSSPEFSRGVRRK